MTKQQELEIYEKALIDWETKAKNEQSLYTFDGLCYYFFQTQSISLLKGLTTLLSLRDGKPIKKLWFNAGDPFPRIELLKTAIAIVKQQIEDETRNKI